MWWVAVRVLALALRPFVHLRCEGLEHLPRRGPALLAANHVSFLDPVVLLVVGHRAGRKVRFLAVEEAFAKPVLGWFLRVGRQIPVPEDANRSAAIRAAREALEGGEVVLVYPEGTIPAAGEVEQAKAGVGLLAAVAGVPVVPIGTAGLERGQRGRRRAVVVIGPPVAVTSSGRGRAHYAGIAQQVLDEVRRCAARAAERRAEATAVEAGDRRRR